MAGSSLDANVVFPPYENSKDVLSGWSIEYHRDHYKDVSIEQIAPSAAKANSSERQGMVAAHGQSENEREQTGDETKNLISKLNQLPEEFSEDDIISWIQECYSLNLKVDINRLARFAMGRNALTALKYLVDKEKADLSSTDICGRTAIFYALWDYPNTQMFAYIKSKVSPKSEILNCQDTVKQFTALDYAILSNKLDAIELLLTLGANTRGKDTWMRKPWYMQSLFGLNDLAGTVPEFCILGVLPRPSFRGRFYHTLGEIHMDLYSSLFDDLELSLPLLWVHLPWTNGILFFVRFEQNPWDAGSDIFKFALRRYGRAVGYTTCVTDWLPSLFRESVKVPANLDLPYTDPLYESNFRLAPEIPQNFIVTRAHQRRARRHINNVRAKMTREPAKILLQSERTLDEVYFPSLSSDALDIRNESQVVYRACTKTLDLEPTNEDTKPILMTSQLWLWRCGRFILTSFSENLPNGGPPRLYLKWSAMVDPPPPAGIQTGLFMAHCVSEFGKPQCDGKFPSPLDIFEASVVQILADVDEYMNPEQPSRPEMKKEHDFMFEIADIREELVMIQEVLGQQHEIMQNYIEDCDNNPRLLYYPQGEESMPKLGAEHWETVKRCKNTIEKYQKRVEKIDGDAQRVEKRIQDQLNLKRTHVSINDARAGLILSTAVIGFTVITIIFAPLAFVTALFALPLDVLLRNQSPLTGTGGSSDTGEGMQPAGAYTTKYVGTWFAVAEVVSLTVTLLIVVLFLWLLGGTEGFAALQGNRSGRTERRRWYDFRNKPHEKTAKPREVDENESGQSREHTGLRRRAANVQGRRKQGSSTEV